MERLTKVGKIKPQCSIDIKESRLGIGMEKLDRDAFDPEKAYDKVRWSCLKEIMQRKNFSDKWIEWIMHTVSSGRVGVKVNGENGNFFRTFKGVRQGDSLSLFLFAREFYRIPSQIKDTSCQKCAARR